MIKKHLMTPGPTEVPPEVLAAASQPVVHHRTKYFKKILRSVSQNLKVVFQTQSPVIILSSSGTGAMEAALVNLCEPQDKILVLSAGVFGERWGKIGEALGLKVVALEFEWGTPVVPEVVESALREHSDAVVVCGTLTETSTGVDHPVREIAEVVGRSGACFVVDAIGGLGSSVLKMDEWGIDVVVGGCQKGLMTPPGLAFAAISDKAEERLRSVKKRSLYFSFEAALKSLLQEELPTTPWTTSVSLVQQLNESLKLILSEGIEEVWRRHELMARAVRAGCAAMGVDFFARTSPSQSVTSIKVQEGFDAGKVVERMRDDWGISIAGGQGKLKSKIFRIGHMGYCDRTDVLMVLSVLEIVLHELGMNVNRGAGVVAAQDAFLGQLGYLHMECDTGLRMSSL